jgi:hypothetical protein
MKTSVLSAFVCALVMALYAIPANAQATRTWVSGVGDDANPCSRTAPCKTFAGAISKTAAGGEIDALDPGGFGALTITKAITLDGGGGQVASILVSGTNAINVSAGASDVVVIKNLRFQGLGSGLTAINFNTGAALLVDNVEIYGFTNQGIKFAANGSASLSVQDTLIFNCTGGGVLVAPVSGTAGAAITKTRVFRSQYGVKAQDNAKVNVSFSVTSNNIANGVVAISTTSAAEINVSNSMISNNPNSGIATNGGNALVRILNTAITDNGISINTSGGGNVTSTTPATNFIAGNGTNNGPTGTATGLQ